MLFRSYFADNLTFFSSNTVTGTSVVTSISGLNDNSQAKSDYYSYRWTGYFRPTQTGTYTLQTSSDDSSLVYVGVAGGLITDYISTLQASSTIAGKATLVVSNSGTHPPSTRNGSLSVTSGYSYPIVIYFGENDGGAAKIGRAHV